MTTTAITPDTETVPDSIELAAAIGPELAAHAARHDADGSFVHESYDALKRSGLLALAVPVELGGHGASIAEVARVQRELAHHCGSTALASSMHQHVVTFTAWRYRRGLPGAEATLKRVAEEGILLVSTGGADFTNPRGTATKVDGGYRVSGTKIFASQSEVGTVMSTMFAYEDPEQGLRILNMAVPIASEGVTVGSNWDTLGMRGTASNDITLTDVFVPDERVIANRPHGVIDPPLQVIISIAMPIITGVYLGVAEAAYAAARASAKPGTERELGLMRHKLQVAEWALEGALAAVGDDPEPSMDNVDAVMIAKREVALAGIEVCDLAMDVAGGAAFFKGSVIERCYRDIRAAKFHPFGAEATLRHLGGA